MCCVSRGTATKILELALDKTDFSSAAVALAVRHAAVHMEAMGFWSPSLYTVGCP